MDSGFNDDDAVQMAHILGRGTLIGIPSVFIVTLIIMFGVGVRGAGAVFIAFWGSLIGGTFIGCAVVLAKELGTLGGVEQVARPERESSKHHRFHWHHPVAHG
ncbi:MAG TPA: hypothetical protein VFW71_09995 [Actinomycetota bacterium]|nr:hypothetical protein [Actinomycetota bacterium]